MAYHLNQADAAHFHRDGYVLVRNFFSKEEINKLYSIAVGDRVMQQHATQVTDKAGKQTKLTLWYTPGEDVYSLLLRSERMVKGAALLLDSSSPVCHFPINW